jgi:hypothetical protein
MCSRVKPHNITVVTMESTRTTSPKRRKKKRRPKSGGSVVARKARELRSKQIMSRTAAVRPSTAGRSIVGSQITNSNHPRATYTTTTTNHHHHHHHDDPTSQPETTTRLRKRRRRKRPSTAGGTRTSKALSSTGKFLSTTTTTSNTTNATHHNVLSTSNTTTTHKHNAKGRKKRPKSAASLRKSTSALHSNMANMNRARHNYNGYDNHDHHDHHTVHPNYQQQQGFNDENDIRTSFPPVERKGNKKKTRVNTWMQTSLQEDIPSYNALSDRFCPLYKPKHLIKGKEVDTSSPKYKMKKWREKYNHDLRVSIGEAMHMESPQKNKPPPPQVGEEASFPFPNTAEENSLLFQQSGVFNGSALLGSGSGYKGGASTISNITFATHKTPPAKLDAATRNRIRHAGSHSAVTATTAANATLIRPTSTNATTHSQHEVQVVKAILHRERLVQMLTKELRSGAGGSGAGGSGAGGSGAGNHPGGVRLDYPKIFSLLDRVRVATVETIEAIQTWSVSESSQSGGSGGGGEQVGFIWHTQNYMMELLHNLDHLVPSSSNNAGGLRQELETMLGFPFQRNPFALPLPARQGAGNTTGGRTGPLTSGMGNGTYVYVPGRNYDMSIERLIKAEQNLLVEEQKHNKQHTAAQTAQTAQMAQGNGRGGGGGSGSGSGSGQRILPSFLQADYIAGTLSLNASLEKYHSIIPVALSSSASPSNSGKKKKKKRKKSPSSSKKKKKTKNTKNTIEKQHTSPTITPGSWRKEATEVDPKVAEALRQEGLKQWERIFGLAKDKVGGGGDFGGGFGGFGGFVFCVLCFAVAHVFDVLKLTNLCRKTILPRRKRTKKKRGEERNGSS